MYNDTVIYLVANVFSTFVIFKFMSLFFDRTHVDKRRELGSYVLYYVGISIIFLGIDNSLLNLVANIILIAFLTLNYLSTKRMRLVAAVMICAILLTAETVTLTGLTVLGWSHFTELVQYQYLIAQIIARATSFILVLVLANLKVIKEKVEVPFLYWIAIIVVPLATLLPTYTLLVTRTETLSLLICCNVIGLLLINILVFYLYDRVVQSYQDKVDKELLQQQSTMYLKNMEALIAAEENTRTLRHDFKHHLGTLQQLNQAKDYQAVGAYLNKIGAVVEPSKEFVKTDHPEIDSVVNYKMNEAKKRGITIVTKINIVEKCRIEAFDLSSILGNSLDNAIEATAQTEAKEIQLTIELMNNVLHISVINPYKGTLNMEKGHYKTTKSDTSNHGFGMKSIQKALDKYEGEMEISDHDQQFIINMILYNQPLNT